MPQSQEPLSPPPRPIRADRQLSELPSANYVHRSPFNVQRSTFNVQRSRFNVRRSRFAVSAFAGTISTAFLTDGANRLSLLDYRKKDSESPLTASGER